MTRATKTTELEVQSIREDAARIIESMQRIQGMTGDEIDPVTFKMMDKLTKTFRSEITKYRFTTAAEYDKGVAALSKMAFDGTETIRDIRMLLSNATTIPSDVGVKLPGLCDSINKMCCQLSKLTVDSRGIPLDLEIELSQFLVAAKYFPLSISAWKNTLGDNISDLSISSLNKRMLRFEGEVGTLRTIMPTKAL